MRQIDEDENGSVHRYTTLDGADDGVRNISLYLFP
jgi:hypothetical protein